MLHRQHLQQYLKALWRHGTAPLNNWISTEPTAMTLSPADLFCWIWSYSKGSQIILFCCQENLRAFKPLCLQRCRKCAKTAHRTETSAGCCCWVSWKRRTFHFVQSSHVSKLQAKSKRDFDLREEGLKGCFCAFLQSEQDKEFVWLKRIVRHSRAESVQSSSTCPFPPSDSQSVCFSISQTRDGKWGKGGRSSFSPRLKHIGRKQEQNIFKKRLCGGCCAPFGQRSVRLKSPATVYEGEAGRKEAIRIGTQKFQMCHCVKERWACQVEAAGGWGTGWSQRILGLAFGLSLRLYFILRLTSMTFPLKVQYPCF